MTAIRWVETEAGPRPPVTDGITVLHRLPPPALRRDVTEMFGYGERVARHLRQVQLAPLTATWILSFGEPFMIGLCDSDISRSPAGSFVAGLHAGPAVIDSFGASACIKVCFTPSGAHRFFGVPMHELAGRLVPLADVLGPGAAVILDRLALECDWERRFRIVEDFVLARLHDCDPPSRAVLAFERLMTTGGAEQIGVIADDMGWSRKHLIDRFRQEIGLAPKAIAQMARFNRLLTRARQRAGESWAGLAQACGYADQAHLVREFSRFAGETPTAWQARFKAGTTRPRTRRPG